MFILEEVLINEYCKLIHPKINFTPSAKNKQAGDFFCLIINKNKTIALF